MGPLAIWAIVNQCPIKDGRRGSWRWNTWWVWTSVFGRVQRQRLKMTKQKSTDPSSTQVCLCVLSEKWFRNQAASTSEVMEGGRKKILNKKFHTWWEKHVEVRSQNLTEDLVRALPGNNIDTKSTSQLSLNTLNRKRHCHNNYKKKTVTINIALSNNIRFPLPSLHPFGRGPRHPELWTAASVFKTESSECLNPPFQSSVTCDADTRGRYPDTRQGGLTSALLRWWGWTRLSSGNGKKKKKNPIHTEEQTFINIPFVQNAWCHT